jgi:hypothetical protein
MRKPFQRVRQLPDLPPPPKSYELLELDQIAAGAIVRQKRTPGIYFLLDEGQVVYVGQSINLWARLYDHVCKGKMQFDRYFTLTCKRSELTPLESRYIRKFQPKYNKMPRWDRSEVPLESMRGPALKAALRAIQSAADSEC